MCMKKIVLKVKNLNFCYKKQPLCLKDINLEICLGEKVMILATKDMGKSTFLSVLSSYEDSYSGEIFYNDIELNTIQDKDKNFSLLPSSPILFNNKSALYNIKFLLKNNNIKDISDDKIINDLNKFNVDANSKVSKLDLIKKKQLAYYRSSLKNPNIVFLDDQFEDLKIDNNDEIKNYYLDLINNKNNTVIFTVSNDTFKNYSYFFKTLKVDKLLYLNSGIIEEFNDIDDFCTRFVSLNQLLFFNNFCYKNLVRGYIIKENGFYYIKNEELSLKINKNFHINITNFDTDSDYFEDVVIYYNDNVNFCSIDDKNFNEFLNNLDIIVFSDIDGDRII